MALLLETQQRALHTLQFADFPAHLENVFREQFVHLATGRLRLVGDRGELFDLALRESKPAAPQDEPEPPAMPVVVLAIGDTLFRRSRHRRREPSAGGRNGAARPLQPHRRAWRDTLGRDVERHEARAHTGDAFRQALIVPNGAETLAMEFSDYRDVDGFRLPHRIDYYDGDRLLATDRFDRIIVEVEANVASARQ